MSTNPANALLSTVLSNGVAQERKEVAELLPVLGAESIPPPPPQTTESTPAPVVVVGDRKVQDHVATIRKFLESPDSLLALRRIHQGDWATLEIKARKGGGPVQVSVNARSLQLLVPSHKSAVKDFLKGLVAPVKAGTNPAAVSQMVDDLIEALVTPCSGPGTFPAQRLAKTVDAVLGMRKGTEKQRERAEHLVERMPSAALTFEARIGDDAGLSLHGLKSSLEAGHFNPQDEQLAGAFLLAFGDTYAEPLLRRTAQERVAVEAGIEMIEHSNWPDVVGAIDRVWKSILNLAAVGQVRATQEWRPGVYLPLLRAFQLSVQEQLFVLNAHAIHDGKPEVAAQILSCLETHLTRFNSSFLLRDLPWLRTPEQKRPGKAARHHEAHLPESEEIQRTLEVSEWVTQLDTELRSKPEDVGELANRVADCLPATVDFVENQGANIPTELPAEVRSFFADLIRLKIHGGAEGEHIFRNCTGALTLNSVSGREFDYRVAQQQLMVFLSVYAHDPVALRQQHKVDNEVLLSGVCKASCLLGILSGKQQLEAAIKDDEYNAASFWVTELDTLGTLLEGPLLAEAAPEMDHTTVIAEGLKLFAPAFDAQLAQRTAKALAVVEDGIDQFPEAISELHQLGDACRSEELAYKLQAASENAIKAATEVFGAYLDTEFDEPHKELTAAFYSDLSARNLVQDVASAEKMLGAILMTEGNVAAIEGTIGVGESETLTSLKIRTNGGRVSSLHILEKLNGFLPAVGKQLAGRVEKLSKELDAVAAGRTGVEEPEDALKRLGREFSSLQTSLDTWNGFPRLISVMNARYEITIGKPMIGLAARLAEVSGT